MLLAEVGYSRRHRMNTSLLPPVSVAVVHHSGYGHTRVLAEAVQRGAAATAGVRAHLIAVGDHEAHWATLDLADAIVFGAPTYMAGPSAPFKAFLDSTSSRWAKQVWKDKLAAGFTNSASQSGDKLATLQALALAAMQHGMVWLGLDLMPGNNSSKGSTRDLNRLGSWLGAMAQSNADEPAELAPPPADRATAEHLGRRVALAARRWRVRPTHLEEAAVRAVLERYLDGLHRGDVALLAEVFHPQAIYATASDGSAALDTATPGQPLVLLDAQRYLAIVGRRTPPASRGEARTESIDAIEFAGPVTATARVRARLGDRCYDDALTLVKVSGAWRIVAKVFHFEPTEEPCRT
ncbi:MAG TPA: nuclear transport factor 2 family protein [Planctomycetota bacterium]|nr:nuclear transport factor 2 family protein [Planctomycetota bacterium]